MASKEATFKKIHKSDYDPELEKQVASFLEQVQPLRRNEILYEREPMPEFHNNIDRLSWEREEIRRCLNGWNGMNGRTYFWWRYGKIVNLSGGKISPQYRVADALWFEDLEFSKNSHEWGNICIKRRRGGFSWKAALDMVYEAIFFPHSVVGMNSKSERDSDELFKKVKFIFNNLPEFLKPRVGKNTKSNLEFFYYEKDSSNNKIKKGHESEIFSVPPTPSAFEGRMISKWVCDEAGKQPDLPQMWSFTVDTMMQETSRVGVPVIFGTVGEVDKAGKGIMDLWNNSEVYKLKRFFFSGWMGLHVDEYGNDDVEECIRWIVYQRKLMERLSEKQYSDFLQRYPITVDEAFNMSSGNGLGDAALVNRHIASLRRDPPVKETGFMRWKTNDELKESEDDCPVVFVPSKNGKIIVYERPEKDLKNGYISGCDPADHDDATDQASDLSYHIAKKPVGLDPRKIVVEYVDRPKKLSQYYEQTIMLNLWYNCKMLIENNRYRMISEYDSEGYKHLLYRTPVGIARRFSQRVNSIGVRMTPAVKKYLEDLTEGDLDYNLEEIPSIDLCQEFLWYGDKNTDRVMSWGMCLIAMADDKSTAKRSMVDEGGESKSNLPTYEYRRIGRKIVKVKKK